MYTRRTATTGWFAHAAHTTIPTTGVPDSITVEFCCLDHMQPNMGTLASCAHAPRQACTTHPRRLSLHHVTPHAAAAVLTAVATADLAEDSVSMYLEPERESDKHLTQREGPPAASLGRRSVPVEHGLPTGTLYCEQHRYW
jgi:hypothetical protein